MVIQDLDFQYMIFQAYPKYEKVYFWIDGEKYRRTMKRDDFYMFALNKQQEIAPLVRLACNDYSFHLWSVPDAKITHLTLLAKDAAYSDTIAAYMGGKVPIIKKKDHASLMDQLSMYGFKAPDEESIKNLKTSLLKEPEHQGFLARFFNRSSGNRTRGF